MKKSERKKIKKARECMNTLNTTKKALAEKIGVSRSTLYYKPKKPFKDELLKKEIEKVMNDNKAYGHRRVAFALKINKKRIIRIMHKFGLKPKICRKHKPTKKEDTGKKELNKENIYLRLCPIRPNVVWAGDFTYFWFYGRFWYLATVIDIFTREIIGWHIGNHHTTSLIIEALKDAIKRTGKTPHYFHSDQGSEYVSGTYETMLLQKGIIPSCSKKSSPWQNGFQESFYSNFKLELGNINRFETIGELIEAIYQQINYYNENRIHTSLKMSPIQFRIIHQQKQKNVAFATM